MFSHFFDFFFLFENFDKKTKQKITFWPKFHFLGGQKCKKSKK